MEIVLEDSVLLAHPIVYVHYSVLVPRLDHGQLFELEDGGGGCLAAISYKSSDLALWFRKRGLFLDYRLSLLCAFFEGG